jgi:hypothetical protein
LAEVTKPGRCQVRSETESPCPRRAEVEIFGVAFCGPCAREQGVYFAIGELTDEDEVRGLRSKPLAEALDRMRRERAGSTGEIAAEDIPWTLWCRREQASRAQELLTSRNGLRRNSLP